MTDAEIIKALECCKGRLCAGKECPLFNEGGCLVMLSSNALALINRQKAEIERLNKEISISHHLLSDAWRNIEIQDKFYKTARAEAIKEFAERLKEHKHECGCNYRKKPVYAVTEEKIDNLVKEMVGDTE